MTVVGSLCTGYGGLEQALCLADVNVELAWVADNDPDATRVLTHHHPTVPNLGNITTVDWATVQPVDVLTAGYPCQPFSDAGRRQGEDDDRYIWPTILHAVRVARPRFVLLENVRGHLGRGFGRVVASLASIGYVGSWVCVRASEVGAPHRRERLFALATDSTRLGHGNPWTQGGSRVSASAVGSAVRPGHGLSLLPTPAARLGDRWGQPNTGTAARRMGEEGRRNLEDAVALLPTPAARDAERGFGWGNQPGRPLSETIARLLPTPRTSDVHGVGEHGDGGLDLRTAVTLLPTPRATDGTNGGPNQRGSSGDLMLPSAVMDLLPTPTVADSRGSRNATAGRSEDASEDWSLGWSLSDVAYADRWGQYAPAIHRWECVLGRPAPEPTEPGAKGQPRLSARFVEWMQGLPDGYVTGVPGVSRNAALRLLGNGVVPLQGARAWRLLETHGNASP